MKLAALISFVNCWNSKRKSQSIFKTHNLISCYNSSLGSLEKTLPDFPIPALPLIIIISVHFPTNWKLLAPNWPWRPLQIPQPHHSSGPVSLLFCSFQRSRARNYLLQFALFAGRIIPREGRKTTISTAEGSPETWCTWAAHFLDTVSELRLPFSSTLFAHGIRFRSRLAQFDLPG